MKASIAPAPAHRLVLVPFYRDTIEAMQDEHGRIWASLKRLCEALGVSYPSQYVKLGSPDYDWATVSIIATVAEDGKRRPLTMIELESLPMWLMSIQPSKVAFGVRDKLRIYKKEAKAVLAAWFLGRPEDRMRRMADLDRKVAQLELDNRQATAALADLREHGKVLEAGVRDLIVKIDSIINPSPESTADYVTAREFRDQARVLDSLGNLMPARHLPAMSKQLESLSRTMKCPVLKAATTKHGTVNTYAFGVCVAWKTDYDLRRCVPAREYARLRQPRLFA